MWTLLMTARFAHGQSRLLVPETNGRITTRGCSARVTVERNKDGPLLYLFEDKEQRPCHGTGIYVPSHISAVSIPFIDVLPTIPKVPSTSYSDR